MRFLALLILLFPAVSLASPDSTGQVVTNLVTQKVADVRWEPKSLLVGDINCDGNKDYIIRGRTKRRVHVAVVLGPLSEKSRAEVLNFGLGEEKYQDSLLEKDPRMRLVPLDYDPKEMLDSDLEGYQPSITCKGIELGGQESDPINLYWNHKADALNWWRL